MLGAIPARRLAAVLALALATASLAAGCGGDDEPESDVVSADAPPASDFPDPGEQTLDELLASAEHTNELVASPAGLVFIEGENRFGFGLFTVARDQITDAEVAIYAAPGPEGKAVGPFPARIESLETDPAFEARTTADDPEAAKVVYVSDLDFPAKGEWRLIAMVRQGEKLVATRMPSIMVDDYASIPAVGEPAPPVHTPTVDEVGDVAQIDTRDPHDTMHDVDLAEVRGKEPTVLLFATPALCASRVCGPVVDAAEQVKSEMGDEAAFVHMEVFEDNDPNKGILPQLREYGLQTEPWLFVLDSAGRVSTRIEGAFSVDELRDAVERASG